MTLRTLKTSMHQFGIEIPKNIMTSAQAIEFTKLDWRVELERLQTTDGRPADDVRAVVRQDTRRVLGVVSPKFKPLQNHDVFAAYDPWVQAGVLRYDVAGSFHGGSRIWILAELLAQPSITVGKSDVVNNYVLLAHGHDGTLSVTCKVVGYRFACSNALAMAFAHGPISRRIVHRGDVVNKTKDAIASMEQIQAAIATQSTVFSELAETSPANDDAVLDYLAAVWREDRDDLSDSRKASRVFSLYAGEGMGAGMETADGTYWGLYNALTEYLTHHAGGGNGERAAKRAESNVWGNADGISRRGLSVAYVLGHDLVNADDAAQMDTDMLEVMVRDHVTA